MTTKQMRNFWPAFARACEALGLETKSDREAYRKEVMMETASASHLAEVSNAKGYEALMARLAADAGDYESASAYAGGDARRIGAMIEDCARQVFELAGSDDGDAVRYAQGIVRRSGLERAGLFAGRYWYMDYAEATPAKIFQMIDSHRRRLIWRKRRETGREIRLTYSFGTSYKEAM